MPAVVSYSGDFLKSSQTYALGTDDDSEVLKRYLRDIRRYDLLSRERERALAKQWQESREQWRDLCLTHLLHVPLLLQWWPRIRRGIMPMQAICRTSPVPHPANLQATMQHLQHLRCQMCHAVPRQSAGHTQTITTLRSTMQELLHGWEWPHKFFQHTWQHFNTVMTQAVAHHQGRAAARYVRTLGYSMEELQQLWRDGKHLWTLMEHAKQVLVTHNLRLVVHVACKFRYTGLPLSDLIQEGTIGLLYALDGFDYRRELKFSTYAFWWIRQAIQRAGTTQAFIRLPEYVQANARHVRGAADRFTAKFGQEPSAQEIADHFDMPLHHVEKGLQNTTLEFVSLDGGLAGQNRMLHKLLRESQSSSSHDLLVQRILRHHTQQALRSLTPREATIIRRYFGLEGQPAETLEQISHEMQLSRTRVGQIANQALLKLKRQKPMSLAAAEL